jgi:D-sedoheptulose 7-phosphate isomerase
MSHKNVGYNDYLMEIARESNAARDQFVRENAEAIVEAAKIVGKCFSGGGKALIFGNGGSAADAQHMAAEFVGNLIIKRKPLPAIALTTDSSNLTAIGNDFGYDNVFVKQIQALAKPGDVVVAISTSGNSSNVIAGVEMAKSLGCPSIGLTGGNGGKLKSLCDVSLNVCDGKNSCRIQESHIFAIHSIVDLIDRYFLDERFR